MKVLHLVTARGGSKGVPEKNIQTIGGLPLVAYKIISAQRCSAKGRVVVSTDSEKIADIAVKFGAEVPFMRPEPLATDEASSQAVIRHALEWLRNHDGDQYDVISLLEPSSPFATYQDLDSAFEMMETNRTDSVLGVTPVKVNPVFIKPLDADGRMSEFYRSIKALQSVRRQSFQEHYTLNGAVYLFRRTYFEESGMILSENTCPLILDEYHGMEIDTLSELGYARYLVDTGKIDLRFWR